MSDNLERIAPRRPRRRNALRRQIVTIKGHRFVLNYFKTFTFCGHCTRFLWGVTGPQGYKCLNCDFSIHDRCLEYVSFNCPGNSTLKLDTDPHKFKKTTYLKPTWCDHCGTFLYGIVNQGEQCTDCGMNVHHRCTKQAPHTCGQGTLGEPRGRMKVSFSSFRLTETHCRVNISVHECRNLPRMDTAGLSDPYVVLGLLYCESTSAVQQKTEKIENTLNPVFEEDFYFDVTEAEIDRRITLDVWDWNKITSDDFIGGMSMKVAEILDLTQEGPFTSWFKLMDEKVSKLTNERIVMDDKEVEKLIAEFHRTTIEDRKNRYASVRQVRRGIKLERHVSNLPNSKLEDFNLLLVLGKGSFGKVFLAEHKRTQEVYAIKSLKKDLIVKEDDVECILIERRVLSLQKKPPFLTGLHSSFQTKEHLFLVMEFVAGGDLMFHILEMGRFSPCETKFYSGEIILGLLYLHSHGIIYRDLKLDNVMLDAEGHIKIADFGLCKEGISNGFKAKTFCGTPDYIAPEVISNQSYDQSVDWWALGVLIYEMLVGRAPFDHGTDEDDDFEKLFNSIVSSSVEFPRAMDESSRKLIQGFLTKHPSRRLGCHPETGEQDIKTHAFYKGLDWDKLTKRQLKPPYKPKIKGKTSADNFDTQFTKEEVKLSPVEEAVVDAIEPEVFEGFSFTNPEYHVPS